MIFSSWNASATALRALRGTGTPSRTWSTKYSSKDILKTSRVHTLGLALVWLERRCARALRHRKMKETKRIKTLRKWSIHWLIDLLVQIVDALCWWNVWDQQGFMKAAADSLNNYDECMAIKKQFRTERSDPHELSFMVNMCKLPQGALLDSKSPDAQRQGETLKNDTVGSGQGITNGSSLQLPCGARDWCDDPVFSNYLNLNVIHFQDHRKSVMVIQWFISIILSLSCYHQNHQNHQQKNWAETEQDSELMFPHGTLVSLKT